VPNDSWSRLELARFLRSRRERIDPRTFGLPVGSRRRTPGLRREEVAMLAGLGSSWYAYLEQGRKIQPSPQVLESLAEVLRLSEDERRYLHRLANGDASRPQRPDDDPAAEGLLRQLVEDGSSRLYPSYATDHRGDLLAWNQAATEWYADFGLLPPGERNLLRWMLTAPQARERLVDWERTTREVAARWRVQGALWPGDPALQMRVNEFNSLSPEFAAWWRNHEVLEPRSHIRRLSHPRYGLWSFRVVIIRVAGFPRHFVEPHIRVDASNMQSISSTLD